MSSLMGDQRSGSPKYEEEDVDMQAPEQEQQQSSTPAPQDPEMELDLFGEEEEVENARQDGRSEADSEGNPADLDRRQALEYDENDEIVGETMQQLKEADVKFPNIPVPKSSDGDNWVIRMPNFVKVDSRPYHPDTYMGPEHDEDESQQADTLREKSMTIKLKVENTLRWRWTTNELGEDVRQSNARIIRWSDGTLSLRLGKELFDINQSIDTSGAVPRQAFGGPQSQAPATPVPVKSQGLTYLVAQHKRAQVLQSEALVTGYMTLRPTGMQSETHRMLVRAVGQKHNKVARLRMAPDPTMDPEREKAEMVRQSMKKPKRKANIGDYTSERKKQSRSTKKRSTHDVWSDDDDDDEPGFDGSDEEDDERTSRRSPNKRKKAGEDGKKDEAGDYQEDGFVINDEDSDSDGGGSGKKRRKKRREDSDEDEEEDPLDRLDAAISQRQESERKDRKSRGKDSDEEMDVESEDEDEEEHKVRRAGRTSSRKKRAMDFDGDEDEE